MAAVPSISSAQVNAVADPQVRAILRSMLDSSAVRNGDVGNGDQAFLTLDDLMNGGARARAIAMALARPIANSISDPATTDPTSLAHALEQRILASVAWQQMFTRIELIAAPDSVPGSAANLLLGEAKSRGAAVTEVKNAVQKTTESLAQTTTTLTASIKDNAAAIQKETQARTTATDALARSQEIYIAATGKTIAGLQSDISVKTNSDNALAQALNTLWTRIGANSALVQTGTEITANNVGSVVTKFEQLQAITTDPVTGLVANYAALRSDFSVTNTKLAGMAGKWSVKLDLNGYISGLSLNAGVTPEGKSESSFIIAADIFAIGAPGRPNLVPFALDVKTGLLALRGSIVATGSMTAASLAAKTITAESGVIGDLAVRTANIADAAITSAKIGDASVDTLKIAGNAVTAMFSATGRDIAIININCLGVPVYLSAACQVVYGDSGSPLSGTGRLRILRDGVEINSMETQGKAASHTGPLKLGVACVYVDFPSAGFHSYRFIAEADPDPDTGMGGSGQKISAALLETRR